MGRSQGQKSVDAVEFCRYLVANPEATNAEVAAHFELKPATVSQRRAKYIKLGFKIPEAPAGERGGRKLPSADEFNKMLEASA